MPNNNEIINKDKNNIMSDNILLEKNMKEIIKEETDNKEENKKVNDNILINNDKNEEKVSMEINIKDNSDFNVFILKLYGKEDELSR